MRTCRWTNVAFLLASALCSGCFIRIGDGFTSSDDPSPGTSGTPGTPGYGEGDNGPGGPGQAPRLPEPSVWRVEPPQYTPEQEQRKQEVDAYLAEQLRDYDVVDAIQGYTGDITYWVKSDGLPQVPLPDKWEVPDLASLDGAVVGRPELELLPELHGPTWTTPIHRPELSAYILGETGATSVQDYVEHYQVAGRPADEHRLYAGLHSLQANRGASGTINQFAGDVEPGTFSLIEIAVSCPADGPMVEQIGVAISIDRANPFLRDGKPRVHVEFFTQGGNAFGPRIGGWDEMQAGFVPYPGRLYGPGGIVPASTPGLLSQQEHRVDIIQAPSTGDWWIAHNGHLLGYYPAGLFQRLNKGACKAAWYGEVYDPTPKDWTWNNIGSGEFPGAGFGYAAYVRDPIYLDLQYTPLYPQDDIYLDTDLFNYLSVPPFDPTCYKRSFLSVGASPWSRYLYLGGPGGDAPGCD